MSTRSDLAMSFNLVPEYLDEDAWVSVRNRERWLDHGREAGPKRPEMDQIGEIALVQWTKVLAGQLNLFTVLDEQKFGQPVSRNIVRHLPVLPVLGLSPITVGFSQVCWNPRFLP